MPSQRPNHAPGTPIPGTRAAPRGLFVSRTSLHLHPQAGAPRGFDPAELCARSVDLLFTAAQSHWRIYLVGNEPAVAHGRMSEQAWERYEADLLAHLAGQGARVARHYACLEDPLGKGKRMRDSVFRFPGTGAFHHAQQEDGIALRSSWLVSSVVEELVAASRTGVKTIALATSARLGDEHISVEADDRCDTMREALEALLAADPLRRI